jgi:hypothetical protein
MTKDQINKEVLYYQNTKKLSTHPFILCSKSGEKTHLFGPNLETRIKRFGSLEKLLTEFECRKVRNAGKHQKPPRTKKTRKKTKTSEEVKPTHYNLPRMGEFLSPPPFDIEKETESRCLRPDIFLSNNRHCDGCVHFKYCRSRVKNLPSHISFDGEKFIHEKYQHKKTKKYNQSTGK